MSIQYFIQENPFGKGKAFFAKTNTKQVITEDKFLAYAAMTGTKLSITELKAVLNRFKESIGELLAEGNRVNLDNFIDLYPAIIASFNTPREIFNKDRDDIKIRCRVHRSLTKTVKEKAVVERQNDNERQPNLTHIASGINNENVIRWPYSTTLRGNNLNVGNRKINSIIIFSRNDHNQVFTVNAEDLILDTKGSKELSFSIANHVAIPSWLTSGHAVYLRVEYSGDNPLLNRVSTEVKTYWQALPPNLEDERGTEEEPAA
ncbi:MAG: hypothetical protein JXR70_16505 [Spirochaetales bacterium]|nr:hypothetical protein [Spirochaetales bacterium]